VAEFAVGDAERAARGFEDVQVGVVPAERRLDDLVQVGRAGVGGKPQTPPDRWLRAAQADFDLVDRRRAAGLLALLRRPWGENRRLGQRPH
jgi:hypothetical protein